MATMALLLWSAVPLTPGDGDLFVHVALDRDIFERGLTPVVSPAWGSAVFFAHVHDASGLAGIACVVPVMTQVAHALGAHLLLAHGVLPKAALPILVASRRQLPVSTGLIVLLSIVVSLGASRNICLFTFTGWPLLAVQATTCFTMRPVKSDRELTSTHVTTWRGWLPGMAAVEALQRMPSPDHTLTTWAWSGYLPYAWRHHRAVFDPLRFTPEHMQQLGTLLTLGTGWRALLDSTAIGTVLVPRRSPLDEALSSDAAWDCWYRDETASVFRRRASPGYL